MEVKIADVTLKEKGKGFLENGIYVILLSFSNNNKRFLQVIYDGEKFSYIDIQDKKIYPMVIPTNVREEIESYVLNEIQ